MGTHPIFESDFDCLTGKSLMKLLEALCCFALVKGSERNRRDADTSLEAAKEQCNQFYAERGEGNTTTKRLGGGGQSTVYKCETDDANEQVPVVVIKMYNRPWEFNFTEREIIDTNLGKLDVGAQVYKFFYNADTVTNPSSKNPAGKIEEFLTGRDFDDDELYQLAEPAIYRAVAKKFAKLHKTSPAEMPIEVKFDKEIWPWNTKLVAEHLDQDWFKYNGAQRIVWRNLQMNSTLKAEIKFAADKVKESTTPTVFCHNDPHNGNIMTDKTAEGERLPDTLMLIDFDNSGWGYRAWDIDYYFSKWDDWPSQAVMEDFAQVYVNEFNTDSANSLTVDELILELRLHQPYLLLEQMMFYYSFLEGYQSPAHYRAYCDVIQNYFNRSVTCKAFTEHLSLFALLMSLTFFLH